MKALLTRIAGFIAPNMLWLIWVFRVVAVGALIYGLYWLWVNPDSWNGTASSYLNRAERSEQHERLLLIDSTTTAHRYHADTTRLREIAQGFRQQQQDAVTAGLQWKGLYQQQVMEKDETADRLTDSQARVQFLNQLVKNGTLAKGVTDTASVNRAGLKTAVREALGVRVIDTLSLALSLAVVANKRLSAGLKTAGAGMRTLSAQTRAMKRGGIWPLNVKRRNQLERSAVGMDSVVEKVEVLSELEQALNPVRQ
ncbi:hypothetical protein [Spirosoma luteum]|uniref:hypothetical protein n=1 Tax=Spirosoma luteum TaxID=431553 RepID=UPI00036BD094|nr:hypothetical protein [Spirosoma luteum]